MEGQKRARKFLGYLFTIGLEPSVCIESLLESVKKWVAKWSSFQLSLSSQIVVANHLISSTL